MSTKQHTTKQIQTVMNAAVKLAKENKEGQVATYIPELASVEPDLTKLAVTLIDGSSLISTCGSGLEQ